MLFAKEVRTGEVEERTKMSEEQGEAFQSPEKVEELAEEKVEEKVKEVSIVSIVLSLNWQEDEPRFYTEEEQEELDGI